MFKRELDRLHKDIMSKREPRMSYVQKRFLPPLKPVSEEMRIFMRDALRWITDVTISQIEVHDTFSQYTPEMKRKVLQVMVEYLQDECMKKVCCPADLMMIYKRAFSSDTGTAAFSLDLTLLLNRRSDPESPISQLTHEGGASHV